jgi:phenylpropionate dioxygenase-like ring-hydroxylating dioxygenase large terminal subunit
MDTRVPLQNSARWVDRQHGTVSREAFVSDQIFQLEMDRIYDRNWVFLGHETEIPKPGDFIARSLGSAPVVVIREDDGGVKAFLNSCRHRGARICKGDVGNLKHFVCPYHGWSYKRTGELITTTHDQYQPKDLKFEDWSLIPIPRLGSYKGLIFGSWNRDVPELDQFLGDFRFYLDAFLGRTPQGMEVLAPPHRFRVKANWKIGALNFIGDNTHLLSTHIGPVTLNPIRAAKSGLARNSDDSVQIITDGGHGCTLTYLADDLAPEFYNTHPADLMPLYRETLSPQQFDLLKALRVSVGNIFPNLSFIETPTGPGQKAILLRQWRPLSGTEMEIISWALAEREASPQYKARSLSEGVRNFGVAGVFEQDDLAIWITATAASRNPIAGEYPYSFTSALSAINNPESNYPGPGRVFKPIQSEVIQLEFMRHWESTLLPE